MKAGDDGGLPVNMPGPVSISSKPDLPHGFSLHLPSASPVPQIFT